MGFFHRDGEPAPVSSDAGAEIPAAARERLRGIADADAPYSSGLSMNEFALVDRMGLRPLAQVMGASIVRPGWQLLPPLDPGQQFVPHSPFAPTAVGTALASRYTEPSLAQLRAYKWRTEVICELEVLTAAWNLARTRALERLHEEARMVGADAVVGVHLRRDEHELGAGTIEVVVTGTAVREPGTAGAATPVLTDLSAQDYWRLRGAGHEPVGLAATTVVVFAAPSRVTRLQRARTPRTNRELDELTAGFHHARERVRAQLLAQATDAGGVGTVGVELTHAVHRDTLPLASSLQTTDRRGWHVGRFGRPYRVSGRSDVERRGWVIEMHAAGTAIRSPAAPSPPEVRPTLGMDPAR